MPLAVHCTPRPSVFKADRRATVLSLDTFLKGTVSGPEFFEENHFTQGMTTLVDRAFRHLAGNNAGSSIFQLSQAMGGGKTHSMIGLGLLARDPALRTKVLNENGIPNPAKNLPACKVIGFNGRNSDAPGGIWGALAEQLGRTAHFREYVSPLLKAPGPEAWKTLLGTEPLIIFLDELPPYLEGAVAVPVGNADLGVVTTTALSNLFVAVSEMSNVCLVISDLAGTNYGMGQDNLQAALAKAVHGISSEAKRIAVPITPVNPNGDELYHILRKRLFGNIAPKEEIERVASAYRDSLKQANGMGLTTTRPEAIHSRIVESYPFHPDLRELVGKFKENEGFQQTRGVIRLMQMVISQLWTSKKAESSDLVHPYDFDLNNEEIASEIRTINPALSEAIAHDIAHSGNSEVEQIDAANGNTTASDAARLILIASLSTTPGAIHGIREHELVDCLQRPGRELATFKAAVLDRLATRAWYLHTSADGRLFFKNQQNLAAKLRATAQSLNDETVSRMLREHLQGSFEPSLRDCYQTVHVLTAQDEIRPEIDKTALIIVRPGNGGGGLPISNDWKLWWDQQPYKNRVLFLSGSRDTYQRVMESARQTRALQSIEDELNAENTPAGDPQWRALDALKDRVRVQFKAALKEAFDQLVYPSINNALRPSGIALDFAGNQSGENTIRETLKQASKFTQEIDGDAFRTKAEARLFGGADSKVVLWSDLKRAAATNTQWPLHKPSALDDLKADCIRRGQWREEGNHVRRGPFPPPVPEVSIRENSTDDEGRTFLKIDPLHGDTLVFETGDSEPTAASAPVQTPTNFPAKAFKYRFRCFDSKDPARKSEVKEWTAKISLKHQIHPRADHNELELRALPAGVPGIEIRYTTDSSSPDGPNAATYDGPIRLPANCRVVCAQAIVPAHGLRSELTPIQIPQRGEQERAIDKRRPAKWTGRQKFDDSGSSWGFIRSLAAPVSGVAHDVEIIVENASGEQHLTYLGSASAGYDSAALTLLANKAQELVTDGTLRLTAGSIAFPTGQALQDWITATKQTFDPNKVVQSPA